MSNTVGLFTLIKGEIGMNKIITVLLFSTLLFSNIYAELKEPEDPIEWNAWNISRRYELFKKGIAKREDLEAALKQANTRRREVKAETSSWTWFQEYHPAVPYVACIAVGAAATLLIQKIF